MIKVLPGSALQASLRKELARFWDVGVARIRAGNWGWGFVKLEPLFGSPGEQFLVMDSDTAIAGDVLAAWRESSADFVVDDEHQTEADTHRLYYDWRRVAMVDPPACPPQFVFNTGQWFAIAGVLSRDDFAALLDWSTMPPRLRHSELFAPNEQGVFNYVINQKAMLRGLAIERRKIMRWPPHGMEGITAHTIMNGAAPPVIIHWAGIKAARIGAMPGAEVLSLFERLYYSKIPFGHLLRRIRALRYWITFNFREAATRACLFRRRLRSSSIQMARGSGLRHTP